VAEPAATLVDAVRQLDPKAAAQHLIQVQKDRPGWLDAFAEQLDQARHASELERVLVVWGLSQADAARLFGVSRQAIGKWLDQGVPPERAGVIADLAAATDLLVYHVKRERIAAVVRRAAPALGGSTLLGLLERRDARAVLAACRAMFAFGEAHG
jgi:predicted transcriptional regulator